MTSNSRIQKTMSNLNLNLNQSKNKIYIKIID